MAYATAARVRRLYSGLTTDVVSDADILLVAADVDVEIDAALKEHGAPFSPTPALVGRISDLRTTAQLFDDKFSQTAQESGVAANLRKQAQALIDGIRSGALSCSGVTTACPILTSDPDLERPETEVFTGDELAWAERSEGRE